MLVAYFIFKICERGYGDLYYISINQNPFSLECLRIHVRNLLNSLSSDSIAHYNSEY